VDELMNTASHASTDDIFRHEALLYTGHDDFVRSTAPFIRDGIAAGEPTLVVVARAKIDSLRGELGAHMPSTLVFADMADVGANPGRIIPAWQDFVDAYAGSDRLRGIGEPVWAEREPATLLECQRHETLLNLAFAGGRPWWLLCPYDTLTLPAEVLAEAERSHPFVTEGGSPRRSETYGGVQAFSSLDAPLDQPPPQTRGLVFTWGTLGALRAMTSAHAARSGMLSRRIADLTLAVNEVATNSLSHGGGAGRLRVWRSARSVVCEVSDTGRLDRPLVDRSRPGTDPQDGRGLWLANQLCDLVQLRSSAAGTTIRLHMQAA
jgi:anti-sigma regulatory factor (Ser/Thr protein kinase)